MSKSGLYIFGVSTTAKAIHTFVNNYNLFNVKGFVVDEAYKTIKTFCGLPVYGFKEGDSIEGFNNDQDFLFIAIQWNNLNTDRRRVYEKFKNLNYPLANIIAPTAIIHGKLTGDNCWISDAVVIDTNTKVGTNVFVKTQAFI